MKHRYTLFRSVPMPSSLCKLAVYLVFFLGALFIATVGLRASVSSVPGFLAGGSSRSNFHVYQQISSRPNNETLNEERANAVRDAFIFAFNGYWETCKGHDELLPNSNTCANPRNHFGASAVDALSTAAIMEIPSIVGEIIEWIPSIDYNSSSRDLSVFETTIRYLAGMLSGYDLLKGPLSHVASNNSAVEGLLSQSVNLADDLKYAFETPTGIPHHSLFETKHGYGYETDNSIASVGTLQIEWQHLSDLTGNPEYGNLVQKAESYLLNPKTEIWPGLIPTHIDIYNGEFTDLYGGWSGSQDSFYEYLIKMYVYDSSRYGNYSDRWIAAADSTMKYLAAHPPKKPELTFISGYYNHTLDQSSYHLTCFDGGNFILGGQVFNRKDYLDFGLQLVDSCHWIYNTTATKLGPEWFSWNPRRVPASQKAFYERNGYYIKNGLYDLRPEVIESYYYAYRATGNEMYRDWAWEAFIAINETCRAGNGFTAITNVNAPGGGDTRNEQESFVFAEVLKYSYLIQKPSQVWDFGHNGKNRFVYNTEAHPIKCVGPPV